MKFADLYSEAIIWTCYLENFPAPERYLSIYGLNNQQRIVFDNLGKFFPFDEFYIRDESCNMPKAVKDLRLSRKKLVIPWIYWPNGSNDTFYGKHIVHPSADLFSLLDNKVRTKEIFKLLGIPTPKSSFVSNGEAMLEKPIQDSAGGLNISITKNNARKDYFLEEFIAEQKSIGIQLFIYDEIEFICADEMLFGVSTDGQQTFTFHAQKNFQRGQLPDELLESCLKLGEYFSDRGYKGLFGIDALIGDEGYYLLEINPRGIAFLPAFFAASALNWTNFETHMTESNPAQEEVVLLDFGSRKKVIRHL